MRNYKMRAECAPDVKRFTQLMRDLPAALGSCTVIQPNPNFPDLEVEFESPLDLKQIKSVIRKIVDGHVMLETVQLAQNYNGERSCV